MKINTISAVKRITIIIITYYMILMKFHARSGISRFRCVRKDPFAHVIRKLGWHEGRGESRVVFGARESSGEIVSDGSNRQGAALCYGFAVIQPKSRRRSVPAIGSKSASGSNRSRD